MSTPWDSDTYYELAVASSVVGGLTQLKLCNIVIKYEGLNIPCFDPGSQLYITTTGAEPYDQLVWDLRRIRNSALRSTFPTTLLCCYQLSALVLIYRSASRHPNFLMPKSASQPLRVCRLGRTLIEP